MNWWVKIAIVAGCFITGCVLAGIIVSWDTIVNGGYSKDFKPIPTSIPAPRTSPVAQQAVGSSTTDDQFVVSRAEPPVKAATASPEDSYNNVVKPFVTKYCGSCHNNDKQSAGLVLTEFADAKAAMKELDTWEMVKDQLSTKQMPPRKHQQPEDKERKAVVDWISSILVQPDCDSIDPGRPTIRRLNRAEYNNTIRDLVYLDLKLASQFPTDDVGYGFDNIGDVLSLPPLLFEKYLTAADEVVKALLASKAGKATNKEVFRPQNVQSTLGRESKQREHVALFANGSAIIPYEFVEAGNYQIRVRGYGTRAGTELPKLQIFLDETLLKEFDVSALEEKPEFFEITTFVRAGRKNVRFTFPNDHYEPEAKDPKMRDRNLFLELFELIGPIVPAKNETDKSAYDRVFFQKPASTANNLSTARTVVERFAERGYRRPLKPGELDRLLKIYDLATKAGLPYEEAVGQSLKAVLVSPHFLFRVEQEASPQVKEMAYPISQFELASRLSYYIWSSMPDETLIDLAKQGKLREPAVLARQVQRMLESPKASALTRNFAGQWLMLRTLETVTPNKETYPGYSNELRQDMIRETELYFDYILRDNRSILELIDSDYTFVNNRLAKHYELPGTYTSDFQRVVLKDRNRGGVITQASVLTVTSNPTRTSPVKRGKWILESLLGAPPPPPPPNVPELEEGKDALTGSLRQRMEQHRLNPNCAVCHDKLDPLGFGLENFDGVGKWRAKDGKFNIDSSGELPDGSKFSSPAELKQVLMAKSDQFRKNMAEQMLTFALGRGLEKSDRCAVQEIVKDLKAGNDKMHALVLAVVNSPAFQMRRSAAFNPK
ncbi:MAG: DUF1592 domain-containing protein [Zavarzinella sp.]